MDDEYWPIASVFQIGIWNQMRIEDMYNEDGEYIMMGLRMTELTCERGEL
jgi:hypothetical protein